jgi:ABC-2 type transport system ATP-binding protein
VPRLAGALRQDGAQVDAAGEDAIVVHDRTGEQIGQVIAEERIVISELAPLGSSLEEIFFELTGEETTPG